jgi:raffinose/stachyose/melibiose transport system permease protein
MLMLIISFKTYDVVWARTKGGPGDFSRTVPVRMLDVAFRYNEFGYAAAISVMLTLLVSLIIYLSQKLTRGSVYEY